MNPIDLKEQITAEINSRPKSTLIISGFPGIGKSKLFSKMINGKYIVSDSDSSKFSWIISQEKRLDGKTIKRRNPDFIRDYMNHIQSLIDGDTQIICVRSHDDVHNALVERDIPFTLIYPSRSRKEEFMSNYRERGNTSDFLTLLDKEWDNWITEVENFSGKNVKKIELKSEKFLSDIIYDLM